MIKDEIAQQTKWVSKYNIGDTLRHKSDMSERGLIVAVLFTMGSIEPEYKVSAGTNDAKWWYEAECTRVL